MDAGEDPAAGLDLDGEVTVADARLVTATPPVAITHLKGAIRGRGRTVEIAEWSGELGDGRLGARGQVTLEGKEPALDLALTIDRVPLSYPEGLRSRVSGDLRLSGQEGRYRLAGDVAVLRALYQRETDRASQSLDRVGWELEALDKKGSPLERVQLDVRVRLEDGLRVENKQMHLVADGGVNVGGTLLAPEVGGAVTLREGGTVQLGRARLRLTQGRVQLSGYPSRPPELDVTGITRVGGIAIDAGVTGPLDDFIAYLGVRQKNGAPGHPQTQGKIERFHQTLKRWLGQPAGGAGPRRAPGPARRVPPRLQRAAAAPGDRAGHARPRRTGRHRRAHAAGSGAAGPLPPPLRRRPTARAPSPCAGPAACTTSRSARPTPVGGSSPSSTSSEVTVVALDTGEILSTHRIEPDEGYWRNQRRDPGRWPGSRATG